VKLIRLSYAALCSSLMRAGPALVLSSLAACTVGPDFVAARASPPPAVTAASSRQVLGAAESGIGMAAWWTALNDPTLNDVERRALQGNLDLGEALTRIESARASLRIAGAGGLPRAGGAASYFRERSSTNGTRSLASSAGPAPDAAGGDDPVGTTVAPPANAPFDLLQAGFDASWEIDLWGKNRRNREAARADAQGAIFDSEVARISLSAEVARTYMMLRGAEERLRLLSENRDVVASGLRIARDRQERGAATRYDAATAATQLSAIEAQLPAAERAASEARNALAFLVGSEPHGLDALLKNDSGRVPGAEGAVPAGLPSDLARARPDIRSAEAALHAATARIGVAKADFYPSFSLTGSFGLQSLTLGNLPEWQSRQFIAGPVLRLPFFEGGRLKGRVDLARADEKAAAIRYRAIVLRAWHEVDDALFALRSEDLRVRAAGQGVEQSRIALHVSQRRYALGANGYLDVLIAQRAQLERENELVSARTDRALALTALYKALGGGWSPAGA